MWRYFNSSWRGAPSRGTRHLFMIYEPVKGTGDMLERLTRGACVGVLLCGVVWSGCSSKDPVPKEPTPESSEEEEVGTERRERQDAWGLPLPPRVLTIRRTENYVRLTTDMTLAELEQFYNKHLIDYEVIITGGFLRAVSLRSGMPWVRATRPFGPRFPLEVSYVRPIRPPAFIVAEDEDPEDPKVKERVERARRARVEKLSGMSPGAPVLLKTGGGELLAPGAKWGVPYTPPEGSPLDKPEYRHNFGQPFGKWTPD